MMFALIRKYGIVTLLKPRLYSLADVRMDSCGHHGRVVVPVTLLSCPLGGRTCSTFSWCPCRVVEGTKLQQIGGYMDVHTELCVLMDVEGITLA